MLRFGLTEEKDAVLWKTVLKQAQEIAHQRAAELVGKRVQADGTIVDNPNAEWAITETTREALRELSATAIDEGWTVSQLQHEIIQDQAFSPSRALTIARTEKAYARAHGEHQAAKGVGMQYKSWIMSSEACDICQENADQGRIGIDEAFASGDDAPPGHPNCLPGDALVATCGAITGVSQRQYCGKLAVIRTAAGHLLRATPNHPVLTRRGWVAAGAIREGDDVICRSSGQGTSPGDYDDQHVEASIDQVVKAFLGALMVTSSEVAVSPEDFHGDGAGSEVAVIGSDGSLHLKRQTSLPKHVCEPILEVAHMRELRLVGASAPTEALKADLSPDCGSMGSGSHAPSFLNREMCYSHKLSGAAVAHTDSVSEQNFSDDAARHSFARRNGLLASACQVVADNLAGERNLGPVSMPDGQLGVSQNRRLSRAAPLNLTAEENLLDGAGGDGVSLSQNLLARSREIFLDNVIGVGEEDFSGHVYNLETRLGWYFGNSIVVHNCRCSAGYYETEDGD